MIFRKSGHALDCRRSARTDLSFWMLLAVGLVFTYGGFTIEPESNCSESGECAPWLVPIAAVMGLGATAMALGTLIANPQRGCRFDPASNTLIWWQNRTRTHPGDEGRIALDQIGRFRLMKQGEDDEAHLYDLAGQRLHYFDLAVIPGSPERWAERLVALAPQVEVVVER